MHPGCGSAEMGCVNGPCSLSFSPGPLEYFALLVRTSGPVLLGLSRTVQGLFRKSVSDVLPVGTTVTMFLHRMGLGTGSFCLVGCRNTEDPLGGSVVPRLTGGGDCHSPVRWVWNSVTLGWSTKGGRLVLRRRLADYQARPTPSGVRSREKDERRPWLGTVGAQWSRVPSS